MARPALVFIACTLLATTPAASETTLDRLLVAELDRVDTLLRELDPETLAPPFRSEIAANRAKVTAARTFASSERKLFKLREPFLAAELLSYMASRRTAAASLTAFESLWNQEQKNFKNLDARGRSSFQLALTQIGVNRAEKLYRASLPYAKADEPSSGLYYLAEAAANARWAAFAAGLQLPASKDEQRPNAAAIRAGLDSLEVETLRFFEKDLAGRGAIPISVRMKESRELLERGSLEGAELLLLDARLELRRRTAATPPPGDRDLFLLGLWNVRP